MSFQAERMLVQIESVHTVFLPVCLPKVQKSQIFFFKLCAVYTNAVKRDLESFSEMQLLQTLLELGACYTLQIPCEVFHIAI